MIEIKNINNSTPYSIFTNLYNNAFLNKQKSIEAISISSFNKDMNEVESRFVNLKYIDGDKWIFFSNYDSLKSKNFETHNQVSCLFYWNTINVQVRLKAKIKKCSNKFSDIHFQKRSITKNALAISSNQSEPIRSYNEVIKNYDNTLKNMHASTKRPDNWGGYSFTPYYFEFWEGHNSRLNKRDIYKVKNKDWLHSILQP
jgi:pyridoxamine 5'-phosphate oxidase